MKRIAIINGPNLNLLGSRQPDIYGRSSLGYIAAAVNDIVGTRASLAWFQSNHEGQIIDWLHEFNSEQYDGIVLNAGAYTHTSLAIADAIAAISVPVVEVHLSNIYAREEIRHHSLIAPVCKGSISGFGPAGYLLAVEALISSHQF